MTGRTTGRRRESGRRAGRTEEGKGGEERHGANPREERQSGDGTGTKKTRWGRDRDNGARRIISRVGVGTKG